MTKKKNYINETTAKKRFYYFDYYGEHDEADKMNKIKIKLLIEEANSEFIKRMDMIRKIHLQNHQH